MRNRIFAAVCAIAVAAIGIGAYLFYLSDPVRSSIAAGPEREPARPAAPPLDAADLSGTEPMPGPDASGDAMRPSGGSPPPASSDGEPAGTDAPDIPPALLASSADAAARGLRQAADSADSAAAALPSDSLSRPPGIAARESAPEGADTAGIAPLAARPGHAATGPQAVSEELSAPQPAEAVRLAGTPDAPAAPGASPAPAQVTLADGPAPAAGNASGQDAPPVSAADHSGDAVAAGVTAPAPGLSPPALSDTAPAEYSAAPPAPPEAGASGPPVELPGTEQLSQFSWNGELLALAPTPRADDVPVSAPARADAGARYLLTPAPLEADSQAEDTPGGTE